MFYSGFSLNFPNGQWCWISFCMIIWHFYILLVECVFICLLFLKTELSVSFLSFESLLCILETSFLSDIWLANIFFQSVAYHSILVKVLSQIKYFYFGEEKFLSLSPSLLTVLLVSCLRTLCPAPGYKGFLLGVL